MELFEKVQNIIAEGLNIDAEKVTLEANLADDLGADSLDAVEIIMSFEEEFDLDIPDEDAQGLKTVKELVDYLQSKLK